jgi:phosphatidylinositol 3-kinase
MICISSKFYYVLGFVQFVESLSVAEVLDKEVTIQNYFRKQGPCEGAPYGIQPEVMDNYVKSCGE